MLETRFGTLSRRLVSSLFLLTRNASDALRLFLTALVLQIVLGLDLGISVIVIGVVTILYTFIGGARSVIWNDSVQFVIYMLGAVAAAAIIISATPGGLETLAVFASDEGKLQVFDFAFSLVKPGMTFWAGLAGGAFLTAATHGTDQMMVQRYLSARNRPDAARAVGAANGRNPISIIIPCHRVIGKNGKLTGYGGGLDVKRRLIRLENPNMPL